MTTNEIKLIKDIRDLAAEQYEQGGDVIIECYEDEEILKEFSSVKEAQEMWETKQEWEDDMEAARW